MKKNTEHSEGLMNLQKKEKPVAENRKIYDVTFKRMFRLSDKMLIKFVNKVFERKFPIDSKVRFLDPNSENQDNSVLEKDLYFEICGERFQVEAQSYWDDMMFRLFEYAVSSQDEGYERIDSSHAVFRMPRQVVVFLKGTDKTKDRLHIKLILPDEQEVEYTVNAVNALGYNPQELAENDMEILLPFQIIRLWNRVKHYKNYSEKKKEKFISDFKKMSADIMNTMHSLLSDKKVTNDEYREMYNIIGTLKEYIYSGIEDIRNKGADIMMQDEIIFRDDRIRAEAREEEKRNLAEMMIADNKPANEIERYTGLNLDALKPIAEALGKTLML